MRQSYLQEWLGLIFYGEFDFGQRSPFRSYKRGDDSAFSDGGEHAAVRKARPFERERRFFVRLLVVTKCGLHGKSRERTKVRIHFLEIHALEAARLRGGELDGAGAFDENFSGFALRILETEKGRVDFGRGNGFFHGDQELVAALRRAGDLQCQDAGFEFAGLNRCASSAGDFEPRGDFDLKLRRLALHDGDVRESGDPNVRFADRHEGLHVREKAHFFRHDRSDRFARGPPDVRRLPRHKRSFDGGLSFLRGPQGDDAGVDSNVGVVAGNDKGEPRAPCRGNGKTERSASGFHVERKAGVERDGEVRWPRENRGVRAVFQFERQAFPFLASVENGHSGCQRNLGRTLMEDFSLQLDSALHRFICDAEL